MTSLIDPALYASGRHHEVYAELRRKTPVFWHPMRSGGFWAVMTHAEARAIATDPETFASSRGTGAKTVAPSDALQLNESDAPVHGQIRRLVAAEFTPRRLATLETFIRRAAEELFRTLRTRGRCDFVTELAAQIPFAVLAHIVGVPRVDWPRVFEATSLLAGADDADLRRPGETAEAAFARAVADLDGYLEALAERVRGTDTDSIGARLVALEGVEVAGRALARTDVLAILRLLLEAGHETTTNALSGGVYALAERPEELARLRETPELIPTAVEEILRFTSPITRFGRRVTRDTEVAGVGVREGERVVMFFSSANRDELAFAESERFDVARTPNDHLALGAGPHFCLGASLARMQLRIVLEEIVATARSLRVAGPVIRLASALNIGLRHLPLAIS